MAGVYVPRSPTTGVLYGVVRTHLTELLAAVDAETDGGGLPGFVVKEFRKFLRCGVLSHGFGFARVRCGDCAFERLIPFSCKGRAICQSCGGRRMTERAAHLVDHVLPADVPVRQWVLSVPHRLRYRLAYDHRLCRTVLHVFVRALRSAYRRQARRQGLAGGETGMVTSVQRFGGAVNAHLHFHTLVLDGLFVRQADGTLRFHPAAPPTDDDVRRVVARVRRRLERLGVTGATITDEDADPLEDESAALASLSRAAILGRAALGRRAGRGPERVGADPDAPWVERHVPLHAHDGGFDLHAAVHVAAEDRERLERLCQYLCRPPLGQGRLQRLRDGRIAVALQRAWADGTTHLVFTPLELLQRLVPLVPHRGSTCSSIMASWRRTRRGAGRWSRVPSPTRARSGRAQPRRPLTNSMRRRSLTACARSTARGPTSCGGRTKRMSSRVRGAYQTAYDLRDRPAEIRVTYPPHPLFGQTLKVLRARREGGRGYWIVELPDTSRSRLPAAWTDHPIGPPQSTSRPPHVRATPDVLRDVVALLDAIARSAATADALPCRNTKGEPREQTTPSLRSGAGNVGGQGLAHGRG